MNTTLKALQDLYVALGGEASDVADCTTNVEVLNAISAKYDGASDASLNPVAIDNIVEVMDDILGIKPTGTKSITSNGTHDVTEFESANVNVPNPSTGSLEITENGTYDVTEKASAVVNVPSGLTPYETGQVTIINSTGYACTFEGLKITTENDSYKIMEGSNSILNGKTKSVPITLEGTGTYSVNGGHWAGHLGLAKQGDPTKLTVTATENAKVGLFRWADNDATNYYKFILAIVCENPSNPVEVTLSMTS